MPSAFVPLLLLPNLAKSTHLLELRSDTFPSEMSGFSMVIWGRMAEADVPVRDLLKLSQNDDLELPTESKERE